MAGGDLDGDGTSEVIVGANANAHVKAFGADGTERLSLLAYWIRGRGPRRDRGHRRRWEV